MFVAKVRADDKAGRITDANRVLAEEADRLTNLLVGQGHDIDGLMAGYDKLRAEIDRRNHLVVDALDGQTVRIPGYVLPLDFSATGVREFMLVPYTGACIHVPPPPPNQMVFVELTEAYEVAEMFETVIVTGKLSAAGASKSLGVFDGSIRVTTGYTLTGAAVDPYTE